MTLIVDDAGVGDLLSGVVIGMFRRETEEFRYDLVDVEYFKKKRFHEKEYLHQASRVVFRLLKRVDFRDDERILLCRGYVFDEAVKDLIEEFGEERVQRVKVTGKPQDLTEDAYLNEIRKLGYRPIENRSKRRAKSFFHMMNWLKHNPDNMVHAKTGWPRLSRYKLFRANSRL